MGVNIFDKPEFADKYAAGNMGDRVDGELSVYHAVVYAMLDRALPGAASLLDVGCATGNLRAFLRFKYPAVSYTGTDLSANMLRKARAMHPDASYVAADINHSTFRNESFDVVVCTGTLQFARDPYVSLADIFRLCRNSLIIHAPVSDQKPTRRTIYSSGGHTMPATILNLDDLRETLKTLHSIHPIKNELEVSTIRDDPRPMGFLDVDDQGLYITVMHIQREPFAPPAFTK